MKIFFWVDFSSSKDKNFWYLYSIKIFRFVNLTIEFTEQKFNGHHSVECLKKHEFVSRFYEILEKLYTLKVVKIFDSGILSLNRLVSFFFSEPILQLCIMHVYLVSIVTPSFFENKESPKLCMQRMLRILAARSRYREFNFINFCIFFFSCIE